jgi:hypothetical protein
MLQLMRQRLVSPMRMVLVVTFALFGIVPTVLVNSLGALSRGQMGLFGLVTAAGLIGQELSSGVLMLTFARPLTRRDYVYGRWLGASAMAAVCVAIQVLLTAAFVAMRYGEVDPVTMAIKVVEGTLAVTGTAAVLVMFSSFVNGLGDLAVMLLSLLASDAVAAAGRKWELGWLSRAGEEGQRFITATVDPAPLFGRGTISWFELVSYLSTIAICLLVAIWAVNRKELSYATG